MQMFLVVFSLALSYSNFVKKLQLYHQNYLQDG